MKKGCIAVAGVVAVAMAGTVAAQPPPAIAPATPLQPPTMTTPRPQPTGQAPRLAIAPLTELRNGPQAFSVVLVVGEMEGAQAADNVPAAARKALTDLKDFLPYKNYRLLDSQWTLCCGRGPIFSRLRGVDDQEYELELTPSVGHAGVDGQAVVNVRFVLAEAGGPRAASTAAADLARELRDVERQRQELLATGGQNDLKAAAQLEARLHALQTRNAAQTAEANARKFYAAGRRQVIDASFRMDVGETVVVGTSRIQGDKALIALLTAVPPKSGSAR